MLVIRLARGGRTKYPVYRIVAAESSRAATGKFVEVLGHYNPHTKELVIKKEETVKRLSHGAQPSNSVVKLLQREKIELPDWVKLKTKAPKKTDEPEIDETQEAKAEDAPESADEAAVETEEPRVATAATEAASEIEDGKDPDTNKTETAADTDAAADVAEKASETAAEAATPEAKGDDKTDDK